MSFLPLPLYGSSWEGKIIEEISLDPSAPLPESELHDIIQIRPGEPYRARQVRKAVTRLYNTGKFKEIWVSLEPIETNKLRLSIRWVEKRIFSSIRISGNRALTDEEIMKAMGLSLGDPFSERFWKKALENIASQYQDAGYFQVKTASQLVPPAGERQGLNASIQIREGLRARIGKVSFHGERMFSTFSLKLRMLSSLKGEYYHARNLKGDLLSLEKYYTKKGYFKAVVGPSVVTYDEGLNEVEVNISIQPQYKIELFFERRKPFTRKRLESLILIEQERSDEAGVLEESVRRIERFYLRQGYPSVKVGYSTRAFPGENRREIHFKIESGAHAKIDKILFSGHYAFSEDTLLAQIEMEESGIFKESNFVKEDHEKDVLALVQFYQQEGFRDVEIKPEVQFVRKGKLAWVSFKIDEGVRTRIHQVEIKGNKIFSENRLREALTIEPQMPYTDLRVQEGAKDLLAVYEEDGYLYAQIGPDIQFSPDRTDALITYDVTEEKQVRIGKIELEGNLRTDADVILRRLVIQTGEPYDPGKILESQKSVYQSGLFSSVRLEPVDPEKREIIQDLKLKVVERPSIALEFGFGYADRERLRGIFEVTHRNLWGRNQEISARAKGSRVEQSYFLNYKKPWFFDQSITARATVAYLNLEEVSFDLDTFSGVIGFDKDFSETIKGSLLYQYERKEPTDVVNPSDYDPKDIGILKIGSLNPSLIRDTRDDVFNPTSGSVNSIVFRGAGKNLGSEVQLVKVIVQSRWYYQPSSRLVLAFSGRAGAVEPFGETDSIHISERFFVGGRSTVRGYDQDELGIEGVTINNTVPIGGNAMIIFNEELRIQLPKSFGLVLFFDHGNVWDDHRNIDSSDIKSTTGAGLRYNTPIGPFRLDWGYKLDRETDEDPSAFHFSLGHSF